MPTQGGSDLSLCDQLPDRQAPWKLAKDPADRTALEQTLASLVRQLARQAVYLWPFMPNKSEELWRSLGAPGLPGERRFSQLERLDPTGWKVVKGPPLFPKADLVPSGETARQKIESRAKKRAARERRVVVFGSCHCFVVMAITPPRLCVPNFVVASHARYRRIIEISAAGIELSVLIGPNS